MKLTYLTPTVQIFNLTIEGVIAFSDPNAIKISSGTSITSESGIFSNEKSEGFLWDDMD